MVSGQWSAATTAANGQWSERVVSRSKTMHAAFRSEAVNLCRVRATHHNPSCMVRFTHLRTAVAPTCNQ